MKELIETWEINQRMNELLLVGIPEPHLKNVSAFKGRNVGDQFGHIHNVRLMWLKAAKPELLDSQTKIEKEQSISRKLLFESLESSAVAITELLQEGFSTGRIK